MTPDPCCFCGLDGQRDDYVELFFRIDQTSGRHQLLGAHRTCFAEQLAPGYSLTQSSVEYHPVKLAAAALSHICERYSDRMTARQMTAAIRVDSDGVTLAFSSRDGTVEFGVEPTLTYRLYPPNFCLHVEETVMVGDWKSPVSFRRYDADGHVPPNDGEPNR